VGHTVRVSVTVTIDDQTERFDFSGVTPAAPDDLAQNLLEPARVVGSRWARSVDLTPHEAFGTR
jgi:hypothetical protein